MESFVMKEQKFSRFSACRPVAVVLFVAALVAACGGGGAPGPGPRFVPEAYKVTPTATTSVPGVRDTRTGMVWAQGVGLPVGSTTARLPSSAELLTLADSTNEADLRDAFPFLFGTPATLLEIRESNRQAGGRIWAVDFGEEVLKGALGRWSDGISVGEQPAQWYVLSPASPAYGPTDYLVGQDAGIVTSQTARLMWKICAEGMEWRVADQACTGMPSTYTSVQTGAVADLANVGRGYSGRKGWRLPNKQELQSLLVLEGWQPGRPLVVAPLADKDPSGASWQKSFRTSDISVGDNGWSVHFSEGEVQPTVRPEEPLHVRLVRTF
jgi:hypothetical protein